MEEHDAAMEGRVLQVEVSGGGTPVAIDLHLANALAAGVEHLERTGDHDAAAALVPAPCGGGRIAHVEEVGLDLDPVVGLALLEKLDAPALLVVPAVDEHLLTLLQVLGPP